jgi:diguanylate cyclase (GGDEF)-like protein
VRDRVHGLKTGAAEYIGKPYDSGYLVARARELIRLQQPRPITKDRATILVIDDSATFRNKMREALEAAGYQVTTSSTGEDGLHAAVNQRPAGVIVDHGLPGIDGVTVVRRMREDTVLRRTPCLLLTGSEDRSQELRALDAGADGFVRKDEDLGVVLARLAAVLRSASAPSAIDSLSSVLGPKRVLAVDDSNTYLEELATHLRLDGYDVVLARSGEEALELAAAQSVDCILLDLIMPGLSGHETCRRMKDTLALCDIPLLMLTGVEDQQAMIEGISAGADDYIPKSSEFDVVRARVRAALRRKQLEDENRGMHEQLLRKEMEATEARAQCELAETRAALLVAAHEVLKFEASYDSSLRIWNRRGIMELLSKEIKKAKRSQPSLSVFLADLDFFKRVNDGYGHLVGDDVLRGAAERMSIAVRGSDQVGRYGGEEFLAVLPNCTAEAALEVAERVRQAIGNEPLADEVRITVSIGVAQWHSGQEILDLLHRADVAMYRAKQNGRNRVEVDNASAVSM